MTVRAPLLFSLATLLAWQSPGMAETFTIERPQPWSSPVTHAAVSLVVPGAGQWLNRDEPKHWIHLGTAAAIPVLGSAALLLLNTREAQQPTVIAFSLASLGWGLYSAYDAYQVAQSHQPVSAASLRAKIVPSRPAAAPARPMAADKPQAVAPRPIAIQPVAGVRPDTKQMPPPVQAKRASETMPVREAEDFPPPLLSYRERTLIAAYGQIAEAARRLVGSKDTAESRRDQAALARVRDALQALSHQQRERAWEALEEAHRANAANADVRTLIEDLSHFLRATPAR